MKTLVLGGGIVGVTTAYFLAKAGHEVTVVEEKDGLGLEATAANAGIIAPGHSFAWASPRAPRMLWQSLRGEETAIRVRLAPDLRLYTWGLRFLRECTADRARRNTLVKLRLCQYSCGHGHMGWTMACGTARIVTDLMTGRMPDIDVDGLTLRR